MAGQALRGFLSALHIAVLLNLPSRQIACCAAQQSCTSIIQYLGLNPQEAGQHPEFTRGGKKAQAARDHPA